MLSSRVAIVALLSKKIKKVWTTETLTDTILAVKTHVLVAVFLIAEITNENCEIVFFCSSLLNCQDLTTRWLFLLTWHHLVDWILLSNTVMNFPCRRTVAFSLERCNRWNLCSHSVMEKLQLFLRVDSCLIVVCFELKSWFKVE